VPKADYVEHYKEENDHHDEENNDHIEENRHHKRVNTIRAQPP